MTSRQRSKTEGFTLIEVMIVLVIIGILASFVVPRLMERPDQARHVKVQQDIRVIESALNLYRLDNFTYPNNQQGLQALVTQPMGITAPKNWSGPYLDRLPLDPWGNPYIYVYPGQHNTIDIFTLGVDQLQGGEGAAADVGNWQSQP